MGDLVLTPGAVPEMVRKAFKLAQTERPGAVYLAVPEDIEAMPAPGGLAPLNLNIPRPDEPSPSQIERAAAVLNGARRPVVLAGHGAAAARRPLYGASPSSWACRWRPPFTARGCSLTTTRTRLARWGS